VVAAPACKVTGMVAREEPLTAEQRKKLTSLQRVFVPLPR